MKLSSAAWLLVLCMPLGCDRSSTTAEVKQEPAHVAHRVEEQSLNTITLTEKAWQRLAIELVEVRREVRTQHRSIGGEVVIPPGQTIVISAPVAGTILSAETAVPIVGNQVGASQPIFALKPLLTPERDVLTPAERVRVAQTKADIATALLVAERDVQSAAVRVKAAQIAHDRAVDLLQNKAGSQRSLDEAEANLKLARQAEETAQVRLDFLKEIDLDEESGDLTPRIVKAPVKGVMQQMEVAIGETVVAGEPLFSIVQMDRVWVRVPLYVGHWRRVDTAAGAMIAEYGQAQDAPGRHATYVAAPPSANALATSVDLFYELANDDRRLYPGQKLQVTLPLDQAEPSLVVPFSAVVYDIHGGAWVYEQIEPHSFVRSRVTVRYVDGGDAILASGPPLGTKVVTDGAAELFGTEFGVGH